MKRLPILTCLPLLAADVLACSGGGGGGAGGAGGANTCMGPSIIANEANDYSFSSTLTFPPVKVAPKSN